MNRVWPVVVMLACLFAGVLRVSASLATVRLANRDYVRLADWAKLRGLKVTQVAGSRLVIATNTAHRIEFQIDTSRVEFDGVSLWFSFPVLASDGLVFVSRQDARGVLDALLVPRALPPGKRIRTICLDPGHGGKEPGQIVGKRFEKTYTLALAQEVRSRLVQQGFNVIMTRRQDAYVDFPDRTGAARRAGADLFVSLHYNAAAAGNSDAGGIEVYAMTPEGARSTNVGNDIGSLRAWAGNEFDSENVLLAYHLQRSLLRRLPGTTDRGVRRARFIVLRLAEMPAVLVEGGFMSNAADARWIYSETGRRKMAAAIVEGIQAYRRQIERSPSASPQRTTSSKSSSNKAVPPSAKN